MQVKFNEEFSSLKQILFSKERFAQPARKSLREIIDERIEFAPKLSNVEQLEQSDSEIADYLEDEGSTGKILSQYEVDTSDLRARYSPVSSKAFLKLAAPKRIELETQSINPPLTAPEVVQITPVKMRAVTETDLKEFVSGLVDDVARKLEIDPELGLAIVETESSYQPSALSNDGHASKGLFQLLDSTGQELLAQHFPDRNYDPFDPHLNVELGMRHLQRMIDIFSEDTPLTQKLSTKKAANATSKEKLAVAAYNAGEGRVAWAQHQVARKGGNPGDFMSVKPYLPSITQNYVDKVQRLRGNVN